jgi:hypothetical protein
VQGALAGLSSPRQPHYAGQKGPGVAAQASLLSAAKARKTVDGVRSQSPWSHAQEQ